MRKEGVFQIYIFFVSLVIVLLGIFGCSNPVLYSPSQETELQTDELIAIGFSQLGAESDWREANTTSIEETFTADNGYDLLMENGQQQQSNQITSIRRFIQQDVDYIVLQPVTELGWDTVLSEAKEAGIPVIIADRMVNVDDESLYVCRIGSDFKLEGAKAAQWLKQFSEEKGIAPSDLHIVDIQGTIGATAQIGRTESLEIAAEENGWDLVEEVEGEFTMTRGYEAMQLLLQQYNNINIVYCENDNSALGAIDAIEEAGFTVGFDMDNSDILVISFDGINKEAVNDVMLGKIACIAGCNPRQGPLISDVIQKLEKGEKPDRIIYVEEGIYSSFDKIRTLELNGTKYPVTILNEEDSSQME